jgi:HSP20 family molecular chaperone IbpA
MFPMARPHKKALLMRRVTLLDGNLWLGFAAHEARKPGDAGYPPYNIELVAEDPQALRITFAVAGFGPDQLEVSLDGGELSIRGKQGEEQHRDYLHRGIATRQFRRSFQLASGVEVRNAELDNGLLVIELVRPHKEKRVTKIAITAAG